MWEVNDMSFTLAYPAIIPLIEWQAFLTGMPQLIFDQGEPFRDGFVLDCKT
jgi:proline racemase